MQDPIEQEIITGDWQDVIGTRITACDAIITDPPYARRVHEGQHRRRRAIPYGSWGETEIREAMRAWDLACDGWIVVLTDHRSAVAWEAAARDVGRVTFAPVPCVDLRGAPRLAGDGPASWTVWLLASRPRGRGRCWWGSLPGVYLYRHRGSCRPTVLGGKDLSLMSAIIGDYTRAGDLVVDPCCGVGTTCVAAIRRGRRTIGIERDRDRAALARDWCDREGAQVMLPFDHHGTRGSTRNDRADR